LFSWEFIPEENASKPTVGRSSGGCHDDFTTVGEAEPYVGKHVPKGDVSQWFASRRWFFACPSYAFER